LDIKINDTSASERELEVTLSYDEIKNEIETEVKKQIRSIQIPGFRKGKVPLPMIKKMYGDALEYDASEKVANTRFWKAAEEKELKPIGRPTMTDIKFVPNESLSFKVSFEIIPELDVKNYTGNRIEIPDFTVADKDIDMEVKHLLRQYETTEPAEEITDDKSIVFTAELQRMNENGEPFENSVPETIDVDLSNEKIHPDIISNTKGKKAGDSFDFSFEDKRNIKREDNTEEEVIEKYIYQGKILEVKKRVYPELNEELVKKISKDKFSTEDELRNHIKQDIQNYYDNQLENFAKERLIKTVIENNDFTPPASLVASYVEDMIKREEEHGKKHKHKINKEELKERFHPTAVYSVKWFLLRDQIIKKENISLTDEDIMKAAEKEAPRFGLAPENLVEFYKKGEYNDQLLEEKLFSFLKEKNDLVKIDPKDLANKKSEENL
jgi:trigger factor